jgi:hypothetical protein
MSAATTDVPSGERRDGSQASAHRLIQRLCALSPLRTA